MCLIHSTEILWLLFHLLYQVTKSNGQTFWFSQGWEISFDASVAVLKLKEILRPNQVCHSSTCTHSCRGMKGLGGSSGDIKGNPSCKAFSENQKLYFISWMKSPGRDSKYIFSTPGCWEFFPKICAPGFFSHLQTWIIQPPFPFEIQRVWGLIILPFYIVDFWYLKLLKTPWFFSYNCSSC